MKEEKSAFLGWVKSHKKQLILAGVSIIGIILVILGIKNKASLKALWSSLKASIARTPVTKVTTTQVTGVTQSVKLKPIPETPIISRAAHDVSKHIRTLPPGRHASPIKQATAAANGFTLLPNQTWVKGYSTHNIAA